MNKHDRVWSLQEAKARFSEVVRRARAEGPQIVTVHGKEAVIISSSDAQKPSVGETGKSLVDLLEKSPLRLLDEAMDKRPNLPARNRSIKL